MAAPRQDKSLTWLPIAGALAIALLGVILIVSVGSGKDTRLGVRTSEDGALACPATYDFAAVTGVARVPRAWVPIIPSGVDGTDHLIPDAKPQHVTVCRYPAAGTASGTATKIALGGRTVVRTNTRDMTHALSTAPKVGAPTSGRCGEPGTTYLAGFIFATGVEWISLPGTGCQRVTNGVYDTSASFTQQVAAAFASGTWS